MIGSQLRLRPRGFREFRAAAFSQLDFWVDMLWGRVLPRKFEKFHNWAKPSPRSNPAIMHRTITGILRKIREIEAVSMGVETVQGYNLHGPLVATQKPGITNKRQFSSNSPAMRFLVTPCRQILNLVLNLVCRPRRLSFDY